MTAPDSEIERLIAQLASLRDGAKAVALLIACGARAIPPLRGLLLNGRPSGTYQPRCWAVEALGGLGAKEALMEYLARRKEIADPVARFGEEAVRSEAARQLGSWRDEDVFQLLLDLVRGKFLVGAIEALAEFGRVEVIPHFDRALEDDFYRPAAEDGFRKLGAAAREALILSALTPLSVATNEHRSSLRRRKSALMLVGEIGIRVEDWDRLRPLLEETEPEVVVGAARLAMVIADSAERRAITHRLLAVLPAAEWFLQDEIENCLAGLCDAEAVIDDAIERRMEAPGIEPAVDSALRTLMRVKRRFSAGSQSRPSGNAGRT